MSELTPFHLAISVKSLNQAQQFYGQLLGCEAGRSTDHWIDYNFFGHQLVCHLSKNKQNTEFHNSVDEKNVPIPHFGVVLEITQWYELRDKILANKVKFIIEPDIRFAGQAGEQATMIFCDPSGNALEFKSFKSIETDLFKK